MNARTTPSLAPRHLSPSRTRTFAAHATAATTLALLFATPLGCDSSASTGTGTTTDGGTGGSATTSNGGTGGGASNGGAGGAGATTSNGGAGSSSTTSSGGAGGGPNGGPARPFPQESRPFGTRPQNHSQGELNDAVRSYYEYWKSTYVEPSSGATPGGGYIVHMTGVGPGAAEAKTTSEAHGYGMIIFALMAGHDPEAKAYFDGMYNMFDQHRSTLNSANMSWIIANSEASGADSDSATDGDMDIAYSLILADRQWGSLGGVNYLDEAKNTIQEGVKGGDMGPNQRPALGDWDSDPWNTRASDWMTGHMRAYQDITGDAYWASAADTIYGVLFSIQQNHSPATGLLPDFVIDATPKPAPDNYLDEGTVDFSWNACRFPLRIALDYGHHETADAKKALTPVMNWIVAETGNDPSQVKAGYHLNGDAQVNYTANAYTAPMVAAATIDPQYQSFLDEGWDFTLAQKDDYYSDTITLLSLLYVSGNWWKP